jgi:acetyl-CoA acetyltransferase
MIMDLHDKIAVVGIGETEYSRRLNRGANELIFEAVHKALDDAKITPKKIDGIVTEGMWVPQFIRPAEMANALGIKYRYAGGISATGSGNVASFHLAAMAVASGQADTILTYYTNGYGSQRTPKSAYGERRQDLTKGIKDSFEVPYGSNGPRIYWPMVGMRYMHDFGLTKEQFNRQLGAIAINQRRNAVLNGKGVEKQPLTYEDYLNSPMLADPMRRADSCRWNDGACAWIVTSAERVKDFPSIPIYVSGIGYSCIPEARGDYWTQGGRDYPHKPHMGVALDRALKMAGITREDLDFAQLYDAFTIMLLVFYESLGFCKKGEGGAIAESGGMSLESSLPINTHGGHLSHSYINMASHIVEAVKQLRGEAGPCQIKDAQLGMVEGGGSWQEYVTIFRKG